MLKGNVPWFNDHQLDATVHTQGATFVTAADPAGATTAYGFSEGGGMLLERARFPSPAAIFALLDFGSIAPVNYVTKDYITAYTTACQVATGVLMNTAAQTMALVLQTFGQTQNPTASCQAWQSVAPVLGSAVCGYDIVDLLRIRFPAEVGAVSSLCSISAAAPLQTDPDPQTRFNQLIAQLTGLGAAFAQFNPCAGNSPFLPIKNFLFAPLAAPTCK